MSKMSPHDRLTTLPHPCRISDGGSSAAKMYAALDADYIAERNRRRFDYVLSRLTKKEHELFALMYASLSNEQISAELGVDRFNLFRRQNRLVKKIKKLLKKRQQTPSISAYSGRR